MSSSAGRVLQIFKGDYSGSVQYDPLDCVLYQGSTYVCKATTQGNAPTNTTYWQLQAQGATNAAGLSYNNATSGLTATDVQAAIDEEAAKMNKTSVSKTGSGTTVTNTIAANTTLDNAVETLLNNDNALNNDLASKASQSDVNQLKGTTFDDSTELTEGSAYDVGHDGYLYVKSATSGNPGVIKIEIKDPTHTHPLGNVCFRESPVSAEEATVYIKKGLYIYADTIGGNSTAYFRSLKA